MNSNDGSSVDRPPEERERSRIGLRVSPLDDTLCSGGVGARMCGAMDLMSRQVVVGSLQALVSLGSDVHLDLSAVTFADVAGVTALVRTAQRLPPGRRMVLQRPPRQLRRIIELFWSDLKCIEVVA